MKADKALKASEINTLVDFFDLLIEVEKMSKNSAQQIIDEINFIPIKPNNGHIGFVSFLYGEFYMGSIAVHTKSSGGIRLVYPMSNGINTYHPISKETGYEIERLVNKRCEEVMNWNLDGPGEIS